MRPARLLGGDYGQPGLGEWITLSDGSRTKVAAHILSIEQQLGLARDFIRSHRCTNCAAEAEDFLDA